MQTNIRQDLIHPVTQVAFSEKKKKEIKLKWKKNKKTVNFSAEMSFLSNNLRLSSLTIHHSSCSFLLKRRFTMEWFVLQNIYKDPIFKFLPYVATNVTL